MSWAIKQGLLTLTQKSHASTISFSLLSEEVTSSWYLGLIPLPTLYATDLLPPPGAHCTHYSFFALCFFANTIHFTASILFPISQLARQLAILVIKINHTSSLGSWMSFSCCGNAHVSTIIFFPFSLCSLCMRCNFPLFSQWLGDIEKCWIFIY